MRGHSRLAFGPLSQELALRLKSVCVPFEEQGGSTLHGAWQLSPDVFRISNPAWDGRFMPALLSRVKRELGCGEANVGAELRMLLLCEPGAGQHLVAHRDMENSRGKFGTLVVMLPSIYAGGGVVVSHDGTKRQFDFAASNHFDLCYTAFYADCVHEVRPIESGYRLCLVYNLLHVGQGPPPPLMDKSIGARAAAKLVAEWMAAPKPPSKLVYMLEHAYPPTGLSFQGLQNEDQAVAQALVRTQGEIELDVYLANVERVKKGWLYRPL